jgi:ATP-dependent RNA helicase SUPV3L1/SUV3
MKRLREDDIIDLTLDDSGGVAIGGEVVGKLEGFRFEPDARAEGIHGRTLRAAAMKGLEGEFYARARRISEAEEKAITLSEHGKLWWDGAVVAHLLAGASRYEPKVEMLADERLKGELRETVQARLDAFVRARINARLQPLFALREAVDAKAGTPSALPGAARGIAHQLLEHFGSLERARIALPEQLGPLIRTLKGHGVWFGRRSVYLPKLLRPDTASLLALLWGVWTKQSRIPAPPQPGLTSFVNDARLPADFLAAAGFRVIARRAIRLDMLERLEEELEKGAAAGVDAETLLPKLVSLIGSSNDELKTVLAEMGWQIVEVADTGAGATRVWRKAPPRPQRHKHHRPGRHAPKEFKVEIRPDSPFAGLAALVRK